MPNILSIAYGGHDTSAALMVDGQLKAAGEEERYTLEKHTRAFPEHAIADCLKIGGLTMNDIDEIALCNDTDFKIRESYLKPALKDSYRIGYLIDLSGVWDISPIHLWPVVLIAVGAVIVMTARRTDDR